MLCSFIFDARRDTLGLKSTPESECNHELIILTRGYNPRLSNGSTAAVNFVSFPISHQCTVNPFKLAYKNVSVWEEKCICVLLTW
jgi:hypothetical protein